MPRPTADEIQSAIELANQALKQAGIKLNLERRGGKLSLRGKFPARTDPAVWKQQYFSLDLDATLFGVKQAQRQAIRIFSQLEEKTFSWADYGVTETRTCKYWIEQYKHHWLNLGAGKENRDREWRTHVWNQGLSLLPPDLPMTPQVLIEACKQKQENTRMRELVCQTLGRLARFAGIDVELTQYRGSYRKPQAREIPTDDEILNALSKIPNPGWALVFKRMAAYGLRDHEVWHCKINENYPYDCTVVSGKTGKRSGIMPLYPEWAKQWQPWEGDLPQVSGKDGYRIYSDRTSKAFKRYGVGFRPYDLRHAWCLRGTITFKIPVPVMAEMAGHSPAVHMKIYNRWISAELMKESYLAAISSPNAPRAPM